MRGAILHHHSHQARLALAFFVGPGGPVLAGLPGKCEYMHTGFRPIFGLQTRPARL
jgi:hypothetical protein